MRTKIFAATALALAASAAPVQAYVSISTDASSRIVCTSGVCTPTAKNAVLNVGDLQGMLGAGDVTIDTANGAQSISVAAPLAWSSAHRLTLDAEHGVSIRAPVNVSGHGAVTITTDDGGTGGDLFFFNQASITFGLLTDSLIINGDTYVLIKSTFVLADDIAANPAGHYALFRDYDASVDETWPTTPIPTTLTGTFEGLGHTIRSLGVIDNTGTTANIAFFADVAGTVRDITLFQPVIGCFQGAQHAALLAAQVEGTIQGASVQSGELGCPSADTGGLVGLNTGTVSNSSSNAQIANGGLQAGGLVGENRGIVASASATGSISDHFNSATGGLAGANSGTITLSHAQIALNNPLSFAVGGLVGTNSGATITESWASGNVAAKNHAGGLVGHDENGFIDTSFATGSASGGVSAGGLVGYAENEIVSAAYARGAATATKTAARAGGLIGNAPGKKGGGARIAESYSTGAVSGGSDPGGLIGQTTHDRIASAYWDLDTSGISDPSKGVGSKPNYHGITGLSTATFTASIPAGFTPSTWGQSATVNDGYPYLLATPPE
jgi:hypothetical protein